MPSDVALGLAAFAAYRTPAKIWEAVSAHGARAALSRVWDELRDDERHGIQLKADALSGRGVHVLLFGDSEYPEGLMQRGRSVAPILFYLGDRGILKAASVGMCGSRNVSVLGLRAAEACGLEVSAQGLAVVSGYARGVDMATHVAALRAGGRTLIVLAEGIDHFRVKKALAPDYDPERTLVVSQFAPSQPWGAHAAMTRNSLIYGLSGALVVIEAGERGGTLAAGEGALRLGRPVLVLDFGDETPPGNRLLLSRGARAVTSRAQLGEVVRELQRVEDEPKREALLF